MTTSTAQQAPSQAKLRLITVLLLLSTALFVVGVAVERGWTGSSTAVDRRQEGAVSQEASESEAAHTEAGENAEAGESAEARAHVETGEEPAHSEAAEPTIAGLDLESPWLVAAVVLLTVFLIAALWRFGYPVLFLVLLVAALATVADAREIVVQVEQARYGVAALASGVAAARLAAAVVTLMAVREGRTITQTPTAST